ncbi:hypothetical protein ACFFF5_17775 [Lederbergia wuyishanensis]|uniref:Uncharacterized protein n=1 Tax=Lederbergia wuyishanensis TaxID=1347903 RepID=A0ABU0D4H0_9BACI|nr:hypothetical protein [Lederbergia wuyishanensis]MCJ8008124.1 hypothetical protein [Lederbergia wuyishanensis]MDQ0343290.1 hypothetical protein [Lederbergia wuyishanensis]
MIQVSRRFKDEIYAPSRKTTAKVSFEILDNEAYEDNTVSVTSEAVISRKAQITNKKRNLTNKYATFEPNFFRLDGSFCIPPKQNETNSEVGWVSSDLCDENGCFSPSQVIKFDFSEPHSSIGITITFDTSTNEYAADFDIYVFDSNNQQIHKEEVIENTESLYVLEHNLDNYNRITISIKRWANGNRRARVTEVDFGLIKEYQGNKLISMNIIEEMNVIGDTIPSNEITFTVDNSDRAFNILNPDGVYKYLRERQEVTVEIGLELVEGSDDYEFVPMGMFYLTEWKSDEGSLTTTFTARDVFELLEQEEYTSITNTNLYLLTQDILIKAGVKNYQIDSKLKQILTSGFKEKLNSRNALQYVGLAGRSVVYQDRFGVVTIKQLELLTESTGYLNFSGYDTFTGMTTLEVDQDYDFKYINFDNTYNEPQIELDKLIKSLTVVVIEDGSEEGQEVTFINSAVKTGDSLKLENPLINTVQHAQQIAEWIINESNLRALYDTNWRQNPALECGDAVLVEDGFGAKKKSRIIKQEFNFEGYLDGKTVTKGGV